MNGDLDTYIIWHWLKLHRSVDTVPVFVDLGLEISKFEVSFVSKQFPRFEVIKNIYLKQNLNQKKSKLFTLSFLVVDYFFSQFDELDIYFGDISYYDNKFKHYRLLSKTLSKNYSKKVKLIPFSKYKLSKRDLVNWFVSTFSTDPKMLYNIVFNCKSPEVDIECGKCFGCLDKKIAFQDVNFKEFPDLSKLRYLVKTSNHNRDVVDYALKHKNGKELLCS